MLWYLLGIGVLVGVMLFALHYFVHSLFSALGSYDEQYKRDVQPYFDKVAEQTRIYLDMRIRQIQATGRLPQTVENEE